MDSLFKDYYYSDTNIYSNVQLWKLIKNDKRFDAKTTAKKDFDNWLKNQEQEQTKTVKYKPINALMHPIIGKPFSFQVDLMFLKDLHGLNKGYDSIINFIEITTKKAYSYPLKNKTSKSIMLIFEQFYKTINKKINYLAMDKGSEFVDVIKFCDKNNIFVTVYNNDKNAMSIVERFNRTLRNYIDKRLKNGVWINILDPLVNAYNNKEHSSTGFTPNFLTSHPTKQDDYRAEQMSKAIIPRMELNKFNVGDRIRIYKKRSLFGKGLGEYSKTIHTITDMRFNSIFIDNDNTTKYRYYNVLKVDDKKLQKVSDDNDDTEAIISRKNYKTALKLAQNQTNRISVKDLDKILQDQLKDDTVGRGKREKKPNSRFI